MIHLPDGCAIIKRIGPRFLTSVQTDPLQEISMTVTEHDSTVSLVPASIWGAVLCLTAAAWSFRTTSFMEAKELCLLLGVLFAAPIQWITGILRDPEQTFHIQLVAG